MKNLIAASTVLCVAGVLGISRPGEAAELSFAGMCDASAALSIAPHRFVVVNDEDNILRVYQDDHPGVALGALDIGPDLKVAKKVKKGKPTDKDEESDIEGSARIGSRIYWITSHGAGKDADRTSGRADFKPDRRRLFAMDPIAGASGGPFKVTGSPYLNLLDKLAELPDIKEKGVDVLLFATEAPKKSNAINIEGLSATPDGQLLIGFRNPLVGGKALIVPLTNPADVVNGLPAKLGAPIWLDIQKRGIRSIEYIESSKDYLLIAGPIDDESPFGLYAWKGPSTSAVTELDPAVLAGMNPEALFVGNPATSLWILSDDGRVPHNGVECKDLPKAQQSFRARSLEWSALRPNPRPYISETVTPPVHP